MDQNKKDKSFAHRVGTVVGTIIVGCVAAIFIAVTIRLIGWILF